MTEIILITLLLDIFKRIIVQENGDVEIPEIYAGDNNFQALLLYNGLPYNTSGLTEDDFAVRLVDIETFTVLLEGTCTDLDQSSSILSFNIDTELGSYLSDFSERKVLLQLYQKDGSNIIGGPLINSTILVRND